MHTRSDMSAVLGALKKRVAGSVMARRLLRRRNQTLSAPLENKADLGSWENEGGNLAPPAR